MNHGEAIYCRTWLDRPARYHNSNPCAGCLSSPDPLCAACGAPSVYAFEAGEHAITFCQRCYNLVLACQAQAAAEKERIA